MDFLAYSQKIIAGEYNKKLQKKGLDFKITETDVDIEGAYLVRGKMYCSSKALIVPGYYNKHNHCVYCDYLFVDITSNIINNSITYFFRLENGGWVLLEELPKELQKSIKKIHRKRKIFLA